MTDAELDEIAKRYNVSPDLVRAMPRWFGLPDPVWDAIDAEVLRQEQERLDREMLGGGT